MTAAQLGDVVREDEMDNVRYWRYSELLRVGYEEDDATEIAFYCDIDLHEAITLRRRGCPSSTAAQILL